MPQQWFSRLLAGFAVSAAALGVVAFAAPPGQAQSAFEDLEDFDYWANLCRLQVNAETYEDALASCEQAIALSPEDADVWAQRSGILVALDAFPEAIASADRSLSFDAKNSLAITYQCVSYTALGDTEAALDRCNDALRVNGSWGQESPVLAWRYRGTILAQDQQYDLALVAYERALLLEPEDSFTLVQKCSAYVALARSRQAIDACGRALAGNGHWDGSSAAAAWMYQGQAYAQLGRFEDAIGAYDSAIALDPDNSLTWAAQAQVLEVLHRDAEALVSYERAVAIKEDYSLALLGQCTLLNRLESYEEALASCDGALEGDGDLQELSLAQVWNQRSISLTGTGQYEESLASINRAVGIAPDYVEAHNHRSTILWYLARYPQALAANRRAIQLDDKYAPAWFTRGVIYRALENSPEALIAYDRGLALNPLNAWAWTNRSVILWQLENYEAALDSAERAIALDDESVLAYYNQGAALLALGQYYRAASTYSQVIEMDQQYAAAFTGRGIALFHLQDYAAATADLQAAIILNPEDQLAQTTLETLVSLNPIQP